MSPFSTLICAVVEAWLADCRPAGSDQLDADMPTIGIPGFVEWAGTHAGDPLCVLSRAMQESSAANMPSLLLMQQG